MIYSMFYNANRIRYSQKVLNAQSKYTEAEQLFCESLAMFQDLYGDKHLLLKEL